MLQAGEQSSGIPLSCAWPYGLSNSDDLLANARAQIGAATSQLDAWLEHTYASNPGKLAQVQRRVDTFLQGGTSPAVLWDGGELSGVGARGAYLSGKNTILLNRDLITEGGNAVAAVLLEELGHWFDDITGQPDAAGDEGNLLSRLVRGQQLSQAELSSLQQEDDSTKLVWQGETVAIEKAAVEFDSWGATEGNDSIDGSFDNDAISGLGGDDAIDGQAGSDTIDGGSGNDTIEGNYGDDSILGGTGNDQITDNSGNNTIEGGSGNDTITARSLSGNQTVYGGEGFDNITLTGKQLYVETGDSGSTNSYGQENVSLIGYDQVASQTSYVQDSSATVIGSAGRDEINVNRITTARISSGDGHDLVNIYAYSDSWQDAFTTYSVDLGSGDDHSITDYAYTATVSGGDGNDNLNTYSNLNQLIDGGNGNDTLNARHYDAYTYYWGGVGHSGLSQFLHLNTASLQLGGSGDDSISFTGESTRANYGQIHITLDGGEGSDTLIAQDNQAGDLDTTSNEQTSD